MKTGLFFGSFNPVHVGHLIIAESMLQLAELDEIWLIVSPQNPFKEKKDLLDHHHRLEMVNMATNSNIRVKGSDVEFGLPLPSYTIDTLQFLDKEYPKHNFSIMIGEDNLAGLKKWKESEALLSNYPFFVYPRIGANPVDLKDFPETVKKVAAPIVGISSTKIRERIKQGLSVRYWVVDEVRQIIEERGYYQD